MSAAMHAADPARHDRPLSIWVVNPFDDVPGEDLPPMRYWSLARALAARGHDVTWWSADWSHRRKQPRTPPAGVKESGGFALQLVPVRPYVRNVSLARIASHRDFGRNLERRADELVAAGVLSRPDVILASLPPLDGPEAAIRLAKRHGARFILDVMDLWPETFERLLPGLDWLRRAASRVLLGGMRARRQALVAAADAVAAATHTYLDATLGDARPGLARHVCYLGADLRVQAAAGRDAPPRPSGGPLECVYAGSLEVGQDLETLVGAARLLDARGTAVRLHVAGAGSLESLVRAGAATPCGTCRIEVHGLLARQDYLDLLAACDVGLVLVKPESRVAVPYKACDYAAAGLAIVNALPGELQSLVDRHRAGLAYTAGDPRSLADAIGRLATDPGILARMRAGARALAAAAFDRDRTYARFADWIESSAVAGSRPATARES